MSTGLLILIILLALLLVLCIVLYYYFIKKGGFFLVSVITITVWFLNASLTVIFPYDYAISKSWHDLNSTNASSSDYNATVVNTTMLHLEEQQRIVYYLYTFIYWIIFIISWIILPVLKEYEKRGELTVHERFRAAVKSNIMFYVYVIIAVVVILVVFFIFIFAGKIRFTTHFNGKNLYMTVIDCSNLYGLLFIIVLMGYSFVKGPKKIYGHYNIKKRIKYLEYNAERISNNLDKAKQNLKKQGLILMATLDNVKYNRDEYENKNNSVIVYEKEMNAILKSLRHKNEYFVNIDNVVNKEKELRTKNDLAKLNTVIRFNQNCIVLFTCRLDEIYEEWYTLQSVVHLQNKAQRDDSLLTDFIPKNISKCTQVYYTSLRPIFVIILIVLLVIASSIIVLGECTIVFESLNLFIPGLMLHFIKSEVWVYFILLPPILFMFYCCSYGLFRLKIAKDFGIYGNKKTTSFSILFISKFFCTIGFALVVNFGIIIKFPHTVLDTNFGLNFSEDLPFKLVAKYVPLLIPVICVIMMMNVYEKIVKCLGGKTFEAEEDVEGCNETVEGKEKLMEMHKSKHGDVGIVTDVEEIK